MRILLAIENSEYSETAVQRVLGQPWPPDSTVCVLTVVDSRYVAASSLGVEGAVVLSSTDIAEGMRKEAETLAYGTAVKLRNAGFHVEMRVREGDPGTEIVAEAKLGEADLVVLGSHGRTGIGRWLKGSVAEYVVRHAPCSVEIARVRPGEHEGEPRQP